MLNEGRNKLLPVVILAHNEEKFIRKAVESLLNQETPNGFFSKVLVAANGCNDRTEEIVNDLSEEYPKKVDLISMEEKGKTKAINKVIKYLEQISTHDLLIPFVIFLDADCEFVDKEALTNFVKRLQQNSQLCAVAADCVPDVVFDSRKDMTANVYRATYGLGELLRINSISGMCYGIRLDILKKIDFPDFQFAEDMYLSSRLDGRFLKDRNLKIGFKTPSSLMSEINRRTRQEISTQRYHEYYSYLKKRGIKVKLFEESLGDDYEWGATNGSTVKAWLGLKGVKSKFFVAFYYLITIYAKAKAHRALKKIRQNEELDYWKVLR